MVWDWDVWPYLIAYGAWRAMQPDLSDAMAELTLAFERLCREVGEKLVPTLQEMNERLRPLMEMVQDV